MPVPSKIKGYQFIPPRRLTGDLAATTAIAAAGAASEEARIAGGSAFRVRATVAGGTATLRVALLRHDQTTEIGSPAAETLSLVAGTEGLLEFTGLVGESYAKVTITAGGSPITVTSVDVYQGDVTSAILEGDLEIGAVELKDASGTTRAKVGTLSAVAESDAGLAVQAPVLGVTTDAGITTDAAGTVSAKLRGIVTHLAALEKSPLTDTELRASPVPTEGVPFEDSVTITRPDNTTAYAAYDRIADDTNDTDTTPIPGVTVSSENGGSGYITSASLSVDHTTFLPRTRVHLFTVAAPTTAIGGDNAAFARLAANESEYVGWFDLPTLALPGGAGTDLVVSRDDNLRVPFTCDAADTDLYPVIEVLDAATPASLKDYRLTLKGEAI
jgi:hypothetical protein